MDSNKTDCGHQNKTKFGKETKEEIFYLDKNLSFTNHGSYGTIPKAIKSKQMELQLEIERAPDIWYRHRAFDLWNQNRSALANYLNVNENHLLLTENATDAINSILKSIDFDNVNDVILENDDTYMAVFNVIDYISRYRLKESQRIQVYRLPIIYPIKSVESLVNEFDKMCEDICNQKNLKLRLIILDHIASTSATLYPIKEIIAVIRKWDQISQNKSLILIDGAHAIGQVKINLNDLDCDYYVSNLHKWFFAPRGCAFLYFRDIKQTHKLKPNIISHDYYREATINFFQRGTRDNTSWFVIKDGIRLFEEDFGGLETITSYATPILNEAVQLLVKGWNTSQLDVPKELEAPFMKIVTLPKLKDYSDCTLDDAEKASLDLVKVLYEKYQVDAQFPIINGKLQCRISCSVYNIIEDYIALRDAILDLI